ncbi:hypothetical protein LX36DRAFT_716834, partial [Colletotrichum falcatum]
AKIRLWWPADGDNHFRAYLRCQFLQGKTGFEAVTQTDASCNLEGHCETLDPSDPETADVVYVTTPRAIYECHSLRHLLSPQAMEMIAKEDEVRRFFAPACGDQEEDVNYLFFE